MSESLQHIEELIGEICSIRKVNMKALLINKGYLKLVPPGTTSAEATASQAVVGNKANQAAQVDTSISTSEGTDTFINNTKYNEADRVPTEKALVLIILAIEDDQIIHLEQCKTGKEA